MFDLRRRYLVEIPTLHVQVHGTHSVLYGSILTEVRELRHEVL